MEERLRFKPFDEDGEVRAYYNGALPHWRQPGCTYFVTFRLGDSLPRRLFLQWEYEREQWLAARVSDCAKLGPKDAYARLCESDKELFHRLFSARMNEFLDQGHGKCILRDHSCAQVVADALQHFHGVRQDTGDSVVMPNHVHALMTPRTGFELEQILQSIKSFTAHEINRMQGTNGSVWMKESYDHVVRDAEDLLRIQEYIRANPEKANLSPSDCFLRPREFELSCE